MCTKLNTNLHSSLGGDRPLMGLRPLIGDRPLPGGDLPRMGDGSLLLLKSPLPDGGGGRGSNTSKIVKDNVSFIIFESNMVTLTKTAALECCVVLHLNGTCCSLFIFILDKFCHRLQGDPFENQQDLNLANTQINLLCIMWLIKNRAYQQFFHIFQSEK